MDTNKVIIMDDGFMWKPIDAKVARDLLLMNAFEIYVIDTYNQTESLIKDIQEFDAAEAEKGVFAIELGQAESDHINYLSALEAISYRVFDTVYEDYIQSSSDADELIRCWAKAFSERVRGKNIAEQGAALDAFLKDKITALETKCGAGCRVNLKFHIGDIAWHMSQKHATSSPVTAISITAHDTEYYLEDGATYSASHIFRSKQALLASL